MRIASIDIGTNTVLLLIVEVNNYNLKVLREEFRIPRIGKDISSLKHINIDSIEKLKSIIKEYNSICKEYKVDKIFCVGTAPFRQAMNSLEVINEIYESTGIKIKVLSADEEAQLTFIGGISSFHNVLNSEYFMVIDIGGGSTELILGTSNNILIKKSYPIGAVILRDKFFYSFPYTFPLQKIINFLTEVFLDINEFEKQNAIGIAVSGTPTTLASIKLGLTRFNESLVDKLPLEIEFLKEFIQISYNISPLEVLKQFPSVVPGREDVILPGAIILYFLMDKLNLPQIFTSIRGVRYGVIFKELNLF